MVLIIVDRVNSLVILLMSFFYCFFHCLDRFWSRSRGRSGSGFGSWYRSSNHGYGNWLLFFLNRFKFDSRC